jgi:hypothetical protein
MTHPEAAIAALYDHEQEQPRRRERNAPDWGGDDLFSSTPRRRFPRPARQRETLEHPLPRPRQAAHLRPERVHPPVRVPSPGERAEKIERLEALEHPQLGDRFEMSPSGRRTVVVTGHPERQVTRTPRPLDAGRRRPAPTVDQLLGHRPDRIAGWAFALGMLLILIAILSAH